MQTETISYFQLSPQQKRLWLLQQDSSAYLTQCAVLLEGNLQPDILKAAVEKVINKHGILRTNYHRLPGMKTPVMMVADSVSPLWQYLDFSDWCEQEYSDKIEQLFRDTRHQNLDFEQSQQLRFSLLKLSKNVRVLYICLSAQSADTWTIRNLFTEISQSYEDLLKGKNKSDEVVQYLQFSEWQNQLLEDEEAAAAEEYWQKQKLSELATFSLPFESKSSKSSGFTPECFKFALASDVTENIETLAKKYNTSAAVVLLACWQTLIWRLTGQPDIIIGTASDRREYAELHEVLGLFATWLPIYCHLTADLNFIEVLELAEKTINNAQEWQDYFVPKPIEHDNTLAFPVGFEFEQLPEERLAAGLLFSLYKQYICIEQFKVKLTCTQHSNSLSAALYYDVNYFCADTIQRLAEQFQTLLASATENPEVAIIQLEVLSKSSRQQLLVEFNQTQVDYPLDKCIHTLFEEQVERTPNSIAVVYEEEQLTYRELNLRANQVARQLQQLGVTRETIVGLYVERSVSALIGLLAILKAGGAYLPLDPQLPSLRLNMMLQDAGVGAILTQQHLAAGLGEQATPVVCLDGNWEAIAIQPEENLPSSTTVENLVYVIYTSGSTGTPKGVSISHRQLLNYVYSIVEKLDLTEGCSFATVSTLAADLGNTMIFPSLLTGGCLHVISLERVTNPLAWADYCTHHGIDCLKIVPSHLNALLSAAQPEKILPLKRLILGGEACSWQLVAKIQDLAPKCQIFNHYGPTETTVGVLTYQVESAVDCQTVPLGRPLGNTQIYLLDRHLQPVAIGVPGELYIGGDGLARGYLHSPQQTAANFIPHPWSFSQGARLYRTGDRARYLPDGHIEYLGRIDNQIKLRGFRIELGEIEAILAQHPAVVQNAVIATLDPSGERRLVAYCVAKHKSVPRISDLRDFLKPKLPEYMLPSAFVILDALPLTANGKVDRSALDAIQTARLEDDITFVAPRTPTEEILAGIWAQVLAVEQVGIHNNFFELGGHSLLATQLASRVRTKLAVELPLRSLLENPTVAKLAVYVETTLRGGLSMAAPPLLRMARNGNIPLSHAQARLWFLNQLEPNSDFYNIPTAVRLTGRLNVVALKQSLNEIVRRHEILRTNFAIAPRGLLEGKSSPYASEGELESKVRCAIDAQAVQVIHSAPNSTLSVLDLREISEINREAQVRHLAMEVTQQPFDLSSDPLLRMFLLQLDEEEYILLVVMHHIITDGWSLGVFVRELGILYESFCNNKPLLLPELPIQYADFALWQRQWLQGEVLENELSYWRRHLANLPMLQLPTDIPRPAVQTFRGAVQSLVLPNVLSDAIKTLSYQEGVTLFMLLLTAFKTLLHWYTAQDDIVVGTDVANRNRIETENLIGFFVNELVLRTDFSGNPTFRELLQRVRQVTLESYVHQDLPFDKLVEALNPERNLKHNPLFQVMFGLDNAPMPPLEPSGITLSPLKLNHEVSVFDLILYMMETEQGLVGSLRYSTDLFEQATITRMLKHFEILLHHVVTQPDVRLNILREMLAETDKQEQIIKQKEFREASRRKLKNVKPKPIN